MMLSSKIVLRQQRQYNIVGNIFGSCHLTEDKIIHLLISNLLLARNAKDSFTGQIIMCSKKGSCTISQFNNSLIRC